MTSSNVELITAKSTRVLPYKRMSRLCIHLNAVWLAVCMSSMVPLNERSGHSEIICV